MNSMPNIIAIESNSLSKGYDKRFIVIDKDSGEILDDAQGYGYKTAQNYYEASIDEFSAPDLETYYAEVKEVNEITLTVKGLSINEEKYQDEFQYEISGQVTIVQGNEIITLSELEQGDIVSIILITGEGHVKGITDAFKITLIKEAE